MDQDLEPKTRPKQPCKWPMLAKLTNSQMTKELNLQTDTTSDNRETTNDNYPTANDNVPLTIRNREAQAPKQLRPQKPYRKIDQISDWSDSEDGKDDKARSNPIDIPPTQDTIHNQALHMLIHQPH